MWPKRRKDKRDRFGNRQPGREFGRQIDADLTDSPDEVSTDLATESLAASEESDNDSFGRSTEFIGADFPVEHPETAEPEAPPVTHAVVRERAMRLLVNREHGRHELQQKLLQRELPPDLVDSVLDQLAEEGLQCDVRFAESYTRMRVDRGFGANKVRADLQTRRVAQSVIEDAIRDNGADWADIASAALGKKFGRRPVTDSATRAKMQRHLYQRGFAIEEIRSAIDYYASAASEL